MTMLREWLWNHVWERWERSLLCKGYNPKRYWTQRGRFFHLESHQAKIAWQHEWIAEQLKTLFWSSLLEVGCGYGRNLRYLYDRFAINEKHFIGMDFSAPLLTRARQFLKPRPIDLVEGSVIAMPSLPRTVEVTLTHGLLMHIPPSDISTAIHQLAHSTQRYLICVEQCRPDAPSANQSVALNAFTFAHPYPTLFEAIGLRMTTSRIEKDLAAYVFEKL